MFEFLMPLLSGILPYLMGPSDWLSTVVSLNTGPLGVALPAVLGWR